jgi:putative integral membrane protein (TIGR02587 family)
MGVAVAKNIIDRDASRVDPDAGDASAMRLRRHNGRRRALFKLAASAAGALFLCLAIVPVDDLAAISTEVPFRNLPLVILLSLFVTYSVVFAAGFAGETQRHRTPGLLQTPFAETVTAYLLALLVCVIVLWLFGRIDHQSAWVEIFTKTVLLAFPASMAAAAGRLAV